MDSATLRQEYRDGLLTTPVSLPAIWGKVLAYLSPLTSANDIIQGAMGGEALLAPAVDAAALLVFWVIYLWAGLRLHERGRQRGL